jgi:hypothetical protein
MEKTGMQVPQLEVQAKNLPPTRYWVLILQVAAAQLAAQELEEPAELAKPLPNDDQCP